MILFSAIIALIIASLNIIVGFLKFSDARHNIERFFALVWSMLTLFPFCYVLHCVFVVGVR